jgi:predicted dehydrogenase
VGVGSLGQHHARVFAALPGVELVAVVDRDRDRAREVAGRHGTRALEDARELDDAVQAATVAVPTVEHGRVAADLLRRGMHVLVEKPLTSTVAEGEALVALAGASGRLLAVGHTERFNPVVQAAMARVKRPRFIEAHRLGVFSARSTDVDVVLDLMIHDLDIVLALVGRPLAALDAVGVHALTEKVDIANARLRFEDGCVANLTASRISTDKVRKLRLFEEDAYLSIDYARQEGLRYTVRRVRGEAPRIERETLPVVPEEPLHAELRAFAARSRGQAAPLVEGPEALAALKVAARILECIGTAGDAKRS